MRLQSENLSCPGPPPPPLFHPDVDVRCCCPRPQTQPTQPLVLPHWAQQAVAVAVGWPCTPGDPAKHRNDAPPPALPQTPSVFGTVVTCAGPVATTVSTRGIKSIVTGARRRSGRVPPWPTLVFQPPPSAPSICRWTGRARGGFGGSSWFLEGVASALFWAMTQKLPGAGEEGAAAGFSDALAIFGSIRLRNWKITLPFRFTVATRTPIFLLPIYTSGMARGVVIDGFISARFVVRE